MNVESHGGLLTRRVGRLDYDVMTFWLSALLLYRPIVNVSRYLCSYIGKTSVYVLISLLYKFNTFTINHGNKQQMKANKNSKTT